MRFGLRWRSLLTADWLGLALTSALYYFCFGTVLKSASELRGRPCCMAAACSCRLFVGPTYGPGGEVTDGGEALDQGGVLGYSQDITYLCIVVQLGSLLTRRFWLVFLAVRLCAVSSKCSSVSLDQAVLCRCQRTEATCSGSTCCYRTCRPRPRRCASGRKGWRSGQGGSLQWCLQTGGQESAADKKRREKAERKQARQQVHRR